MLKSGATRLLASQLCTILGLMMVIGDVQDVRAKDNLADAEVVVMPAMPQPDYLQPGVDPVFQTPFTRVTDPGRDKKAGVYCAKIYCTHRYSSAQTRNADHDYWSETHASVSPDGTQIIWSSNWGRAGGPVSDFVLRLPWPDEGAELSSRLGKNEQPETSNVEQSNVN